MMLSYPLHSSNEAAQSLIPPFPDLMSVLSCVKHPTGHIAFNIKEACQSTYLREQMREEEDF